MKNLETKNTDRQFTLSFNWNSQDLLKGLTVGATYSTDDITEFKKWSYTVPEYYTLNSITKAIKHNVYTDIARFKLDKFIAVGKHYYYDCKQYVLTDLKEVWNNYKKEKLVVATFSILGLVPMVGGILAFTQNNNQEVKITRNFTDTIKKDGTLISSDTILNTQAIMKQKIATKLPLTINKKPIKSLVECSFPAVSKAKIEKKLAKSKEKKEWKDKGFERKSKVLTMDNDDIRTALLNQAESFYPIPYLDGYICGQKNYSIGYGSGMSYEEAKKYWKRAGLSEQKGLELANYLGKCGWKKGLEEIKKWVNKPGVLTREEANILRDYEWDKMFKQIDEKYTFLPDFQKRILTNTAFNSGVAAITGYKNGKTYIPESELSKALKTYEYWDDRVFNAYMKIKSHTKGLANRRRVEALAFCKTIKSEGIVDSRTEKTLEIALNENP